MCVFKCIGLGFLSNFGYLRLELGLELVLGFCLECGLSNGGGCHLSLVHSGF